MRKVLSTFVVVLLVSGAAHATDYYWVNPSTADGQVWEDNQNWSPVGVPGTSAADRAFVYKGRIDWQASAVDPCTITLGEFQIDNGASMKLWYNSLTWNMLDDCGLSGDFIWGSGAGYSQVYAFSQKWYIDGNYIRDLQMYVYYPSDEVHMYGTNKAFKSRAYDLGELGKRVIHAGASVYDNGSYTDGASSPLRTCQVIVEPGAQIIGRPDSVASEWVAYYFDFQGGQSNLPAVGSKVRFIWRPNQQDNVTTGVGTNDYGFDTSVVYPYELRVGGGYWGGTQLGEIHYKPAGGDIRVKGDFWFRTNRSYARVADGHWLHLIDNITSVQRNIDIDGMMWIGNDANTGLYGVKMYNANVRIGGNLRLGAGNPQQATLKMDNATIRIGGDLEWYQAYTANSTWARDNWDPGTSTVIMDGNGIAGRNVYIETYGSWYPLHNLIADYPGVSSRVNLHYVAGNGDLNLTGDLRVLSGQFRSYGRVITFQGGGTPQTIFVDNSATIYGGRLDNMITAANAVVHLASNISVTGLHMLTDSEIYLNGFTLSTTNYGDFDGTLTQTWSVEGGTIYGVTQIPGDANNDGKVDSTDLGIWQQNYDPIGNVNNTFAMGDFDGDTKIDSSDLGIWQQNYDPIGSSGAGAGANVPEPATLLLVGSGLLGGLGVLRRRRTR